MQPIQNDFSTLFYFNPLPIWVYAHQSWEILEVNQAAILLYGYSREELLNKYFPDLWPEEERPTNLFQPVSPIEKEGILHFGIAPHLKKTGERMLMDLYGHRLSFEGKEAVMITAINVTGQKKTETLLAEAIHLAKIGSWEIDLVNQSIYWSDLVHQLHGTNPSTYKPTMEEGIQFYRTDFRDMVSNYIQKAINTGTTCDFEAILISTEKKERWVRVISKTEMRNGHAVRIMGSFQDIHELKTTEHRLQSLMDDLPGAGFQYLIFPDGRYELRSVSKGAETIWGFSRADCQRDADLVWNQLKLGGDFDTVTKDINQSITSGSKWHSQWRYIHPNGQMRWQEGFGTPYFLADGTILFNSMVFDTTEEKKAVYLLEETSTLARIGSWEVNLREADQQTIYWSPMVYSILEVDRSHIPSLTGGYSFYTPESRQVIEAAINRLITEQVPFDEELQVRTAKGNLRWVRCIGKGDFVQQECIRIYGSYQDIQDRKQIETELNQVLEEKTKILESIGDAFITMDRQFRVTYWNRAAEELIQVKREQVLNKILWDVFPDALELSSYKYYHQVLETGEAVRFEEQYGSWLEVLAYPAENGLAVFFRDITLRKEADIRLQKAYEERNTILESIGDAFFAVDNNWIVTYWNKRAETVFGKKKEEIIGQHFWTEYAYAINSTFYQKYHEAMASQEMVSFEEYSWTLKTWFEVTVYPSEKGLSVYFKDIMLRKEADARLVNAKDELDRTNERLQLKVEELQQANEELEQFAFIASHDLQEPLRMISSFLDQLKRKYGSELDPKAHEYIHYAVDGAKRMKNIMMDLLDYSRAGRISGGRELVNLEEIIAEYQVLRQRILEEKSARLFYENLPECTCYRVPIAQTLHALLDNALKYSKPGLPPEVHLRATETATEWIIEVSDNGIGIDPQFFDKIFVIFQRLHNRDEYEGTGIGLSIVKKHVESWGGKIRVASEPGKGTSFYFTVKK